MSHSILPLSPQETSARLQNGTARLIDIREPDEFGREHVQQAISAPLSTLGASLETAQSDRDVIFMCRPGNRTGTNCQRLAECAGRPIYLLEGGLEAWKASGLPTSVDHTKPIEVMRQVQMAAGGLVVLGVVLGLLIHPAFWAISAFVGAGLFVAGLTGFCGMAKLLALAPWNRPARV